MLYYIRRRQKREEPVSAPERIILLIAACVWAVHKV